MTTYFAQLDNNDVVTDVHVVSQEFIDANPDRYTGVWVQTFYNNPTKQYAGIGYTYNYETEDFVPPVKPIEP
jgi:hypothetical protein